MPRIQPIAKMPSRPTNPDQTMQWARGAQMSLQQFHPQLAREVTVGSYTGDGNATQTIAHNREGLPDAIGVNRRAAVGGTVSVGLWIGNNTGNIQTVTKTNFKVSNDLNVNLIVYDYVMWG